MPRMQSSFSPMWTMFECHDLIAATDAASVGPSQIPQPWMHAYSVPERLTPWRFTVTPLPSTRWLPETKRPVRAPPPPPEAAATTAVCADVADAEPAPFVAVTRERTVWPWSPAASRYELDVAPAIVA